MTLTAPARQYLAYAASDLGWCAVVAMLLVVG